MAVRKKGQEPMLNAELQEEQTESAVQPDVDPEYGEAEPDAV